ncbi:hypothetical protein D3C85_1158770 [compost metagenome]
MVGKQGSPLLLGAGMLQLARQLSAIEDVVPQDETTGAARQKRLGDKQGLCQTIWFILYRIAKAHAPLAAIPQQQLEAGQIQRRADNQNIADTRLHQGREGIIDHGLVINRQQLLADGQSRRIEPGGRSPGQDDAFTRYNRRNVQQHRIQLAILGFSKVFLSLRRANLAIQRQTLHETLRYQDENSVVYGLRRDMQDYR